MKFLSWFLKGVAMGAANVIPGVSGGTIAFVTGIYERFIFALKSVDLQAVRLLLRLDFKTFLVKIDAYFLFSILGGVGLSILSLAKVLEWAFVNHEVLTLSFFFGLIIASVIGVGKQVSTWNVVSIVSLVIGVAIAVVIGFLPPAAANESIWYVTLCGIAAVCSMILPGLSGSYILLLMGNYLLVLQAISGFDFNILIPLGVGCVIGLVAFSRLLSYLFAQYKDATVSLLTGFVVGSLLIIWPWKITQYQQITEEKLKAVGYEWQLPSWDLNVLFAIVLMILGFLSVWLLENAAMTKNAE